jgi:2-polyprenyl-3-methyl-5-hydroxy-6-metoxy-1,4-benzoquinol methylase
MTGCLVCGAPASHCFQDKGYDFFECSDSGCGHVFVWPLPREEELRALYTVDEASIANSDSWTMARDYVASPEVVRDYYRKTRIRWLQENGCPLGPDTAVLDVGCSTGMFLRTLADAGLSRLHGVDLSELHCAYVRDTHGIACDTSLDLVPDDAFDLVTCYAVIEHTGDPSGLVEAMKRKLRPGGKLMILTPNYRSLYRKLAGPSWVWLIPPVHLQYFGNASLATLLKRSGMEILVNTSNYSSTYVYLLVHHATRLLGRPVPATSRSGRPLTLAMIHGLEAVIRAALWPAAGIARMTNQHNEINVLAARPETVSTLKCR